MQQPRTTVIDWSTGPRELDEVCPLCQGVGVVYSAEWAKWNKKYSAAEQEVVAIHGHRGWFDSPEFAELTATMPKGSEEEPCGDCEGIGTIPTYSGKELLAFFDRYRRPA